MYSFISMQNASNRLVGSAAMPPWNAVPEARADGVPFEYSARNSPPLPLPQLSYSLSV
jgi:hypothetical protein